MEYLVKQGGKLDYYYKEYFLDTLADLANISKNQICAGSVAYIIDVGDVYILNTKKEWILQ